MVDPFEVPPYPGETPDLDSADVSKPNYAAAIDWMRVVDGRAISLDAWARGNYTQRVAFNRQHEVEPLLVPFRKVEEMRWAYRRLALLGIPVDFIYTGPLSPPKKVLHLRPHDGPGGVINDGCWGYVAALGSTYTTDSGRRLFPLFGVSRTMPNEVVDWIVDEAAESFEDGDVFVAPATLVGIDPSRSQPGIEALADVEGAAATIRHGKTAAALMQLDLPAVEGMTPDGFQKFLKECKGDLFGFRRRFRSLVDSEDRDDLILSIQDEIESMKRSSTYSNLRTTIALLGGVLTTSAATATAELTAKPGLALPIGASAGAASAVGALTALFKERIDRRSKLRDNPLRILWVLGVDGAEKVKLSTRPRRLEYVQRVLPSGSEPEFFHWLCPLGPGLKLLAVSIPQSA